MSELFNSELYAECTADEGTPGWAAWCRRKMCQALDREVSGEIEFETYWPEFCGLQGWSLLGFTDYQEFCRTKRPDGLGMTTSQYVRHCEQAKASGVDVVTVLAERAESKPLADRGAPEGNTNACKGENKVANSHIDKVPTNQQSSTSADRLTRRIARDCPEVLERMKAGEFKSVRAAAIEAGIVKPETPADKLRKAFAKIEADQQFPHLRSLIEQATPEARAALRVWLSECEDETA